jgi:predicted RNA-binding Zn ribbon-like protein
MTMLTIVKEMTQLTLCLDFANTMAWHASAEPEEKLNHYEDLLFWAEDKQVLDAAEAQQLRGLAQQQPAQAKNVRQKAIVLREAIYGIVVACINGRSPTPNDLTILNDALAEAMSQAQLTHTADGFSWTWTADEPMLEAMLWPVVRATADLLTAPDILARVGQCADDRGCGYLFLDTSKNHSRRWCDINDCGNRAKQRRYYRRQQKANQS